MRKYFCDLQRRIEQFFRKLTPSPLSIATKDCCSEMARLAAIWVSHDWPKAKISIFKGVGLPTRQNNAHEVVSIKMDSIFYVVDPTVWQIFPEAKTIVVGSYNNREKMIRDLENRYGGEWKINDKITDSGEKEEKRLEQTLRQLIEETYSI